MTNEPDDRRRWDDVPNSFEWRLLHLEKENDDKELRLRDIEGRQEVIETKLDALVLTSAQTRDAIKETRDAVDDQKNDKYRNLLGFVMLAATIIGTSIWSHFFK